MFRHPAVQHEGVGTLEPVPHPKLSVDRSSHVQCLVQVTNLPKFKTSSAVSGPRWHLAHNPSPYFPALAFFPPHLLRCFLSLRGGDGNVLFGAEHSFILYSQHLRQLWGSTFTTVHREEKLLSLTVSVAFVCGCEPTCSYGT